MEEIVDGESFETIALKYSSDEFAAARFAVRLYRDQLAAGRIPVDEPTSLQAIEIIEYVDSELAEDLDTVSTRVDAILRTLFLPYVAAIHSGLTTEKYKECCDLLLCTPFELFSHGIEAAKMLSNNHPNTSFVNFEP